MFPLKSAWSLPTWMWWLFWSSLFILFQLLMDIFILNDELLFNSYSGLLPSEQIYSLISVREKWWWLGYLVIPLYIPLKVLFTSSALLVGFVLNDVIIEFKLIYKAVFVAEFAFVIAALVHFLGLYYFIKPESLEAIQNFTPLTIASVLDFYTYPEWLEPLFVGLSIYEVLYVIIIVYLLRNFNDINDIKASTIIISYSTWFVLVYTFMIFIYLQFGGL